MPLSRKQFLTAAALSVPATLALAACAGDQREKDEGGDSENVTIAVMSWLPTTVQWDEIYAAFQKENPGITIDFTNGEDQDQFETLLGNEIVAGTVPEVYGIRTGAVFEDFAQYAMPVEEYGSEWIDKVRATPKEETTTADGVLAAVPVLTAGSEYYLYNKTLMDELGLSLPTTYDEVVAVAKAATEAGYSPFALGGSDTWHVADFFVWMSNQFGEGGTVYKAALGEVPWDDDVLVEAATAWQKLFNDGVFQQASLTTTTYPSARDDFFLSRKAIAMPTGSWHVGMTLVGPDKEQPGSAAENDEIGMAVFPTIGPKDAGVTSGVDFALAVSAEAEGAKLDAAAKFVEFMATGTGQQMYVNMLQGFPVAEGVEVEVADDEPELGKESVKLVTDTLAESVYARKLVAPGNDSLEADLGAVLQAIAGGADPKTELAKLNK
ncbi:ABC transporter substrate-binding protein [Actinomyces urogenitalis]|uniref:ABC transporter substrate-binding protein n=1 Tax=Actinomyces urogenitalis TaxID=103621 RepID=UPI00242BC13B|nr:ABC transporter substrate-binding protein [Actinomyces urogenitalis]MCI7457335.1 ABC transporter substrate-binding protein [Actinomyces urogenitalis]